MSSNRVVKLLVVAVAASCTLAATASAQPYISGSFTLPYEVQWKGAVLPAGEYQITMANANAPALVRSPQGGGAFVLATCIDKARRGAPTGLFITRRGNQRVVRFLNWPERGVALVYQPLTRAERVELARADEAERVPVRMAGK